MPITLDSFVHALGGQESGGNYNATNSDSGAHGKYQIMPANWPAWSAEAGIPGAPQTPENQEKVARFKVAQYYQKFGNWGDVAAAWYSGSGINPETADKPQGGGKYPTIRQYANSVLKRAGASTLEYVPSRDGTYSPEAIPGATGTPQYDLLGGGGGSVIDYNDPQLDADYQSRKQRYQTAYQAWVAAGRPQAWKIDEDTGETAPNDKSPEGFEYANALMDLQEFTKTFGNPSSANDMNPAQQAFENQIKLDELDQTKAQNAWQRFTEKLGMARTAANDEIAAAHEANSKNNVFGTQTDSGLVIRGGQPSERIAPDYTKAFERNKTKLNVGEEPKFSGYVTGITPPPLGGSGSGAGLPGQGAATPPPVLDGQQTHAADVTPDVIAAARRQNDIYAAFNQPRLGVSTGDPAGTIAAANVHGVQPGHVTDPIPPKPPTYTFGEAATLPPVRAQLGKAGKTVRKWWQKVPGFADGVQGFAGGEAMLGERGPEKVEIPGFGDFMVGMNGPEVRTLPQGSNVIPMDQAYLFQQIQQAAKASGGPQDMMRQSAEAQARANDPQLDQKVIASLQQALAGQWAAKPPTTPILVGEGWDSDPWADRRALSGIPADPAAYQQMQEAAMKGGR